MDEREKIAFLDRKLDHDRTTVRASLLWMFAILGIALFGGFAFNALLPTFDGKEIAAWVAPGALGLSLPMPLKEYLARKQSMIAVTWLREQYERLVRQPADDELRKVLDQRFMSLFDKVAIA